MRSSTSSWARRGPSRALTPPLLFRAAITILLCTSARAQDGDRIYMIPALSDADLAVIDVHDGSVSDWEAVLGEPTLTRRLDFEDDYRTPAYDHSNLDFRIWLGWHEETARLYVAMDRVDDIYISTFSRDRPNPDYVGWHDGSLDLFVDGDHSGDIYVDRVSDFSGYDESIPAQNIGAQWYSAIAETNDTGPAIETWSQTSPSTRTFWYHQPPFADAGGTRFGESPIVTITELYVTLFDQLLVNDPTGSQPSALTSGRVIGLHIRVPDFDAYDPKGPSGYLHPIDAHYGLRGGVGGSIMHGDSKRFADAVLLAPGWPSSGSKDDALPASTWARVKAVHVSAMVGKRVRGPALRPEDEH
jgi:hypothetical protein